MLEVLLMTSEKVSLLLIFIVLGYLLQRKHQLPSQTGRVLSLLCILVFQPAYVLNTVSTNFTMDMLQSKLMLLGAGLIFSAAVVIVGLLFSRWLSKDTLERKSLCYGFTFSNYGYFGYPVVEAIFGSQMLSDFIIFLFPIQFLCYTYGFVMFREEKKINWVKQLLTPIMLAPILGVVIGISDLQLPKICTSALSSAGTCTTACSMLLAGFMLGNFSLKNLLTGIKPYLLVMVRMLLIPFTFGTVMYLLGIRGKILFLSILFTCLPLGLNMVVFPESLGHDKEAAKNAKLCFISILLSLVFLPCVFALATELCL